MKKLALFFPFAAMTQVILLLNQVILLPMQIRLWGNSDTAMWYAAIALASITTFADLGMRTAGHVELLRLVRERDSEAEKEFRSIWAWLRLMVFLVTTILLAGDFLYGWLHGSGKWQLARLLLTSAYACETVLIVRIVYLDSLGEYSAAESSYFAFAAVRLALAIPALLVLKMHATGLSWLFLSTSVFGLILQARLCRIPPALSLFDRFPKELSFRTCLLTRYTVAEPCANWVRISLPVLVISAIAPATAVTTYVALRAVYGAGRTTIQQVARVASVEYLRVRATGRGYAAESLLSLFILLAGLLGAALAGLIAVDNLRILSLWLNRLDRVLFQNINLSFALSGPFYAYQVMVALSFRIGQLGQMARRQYAYVLYSTVFAGAALMTKMLPMYLGLLVIAEIALSTTFLAREKIGEGSAYQTKAGWRGLAGSFAGMSLVLALWISVRHSNADLFLRISVESALETAGLLVVALVLLVLFELTINAGLFRNLPAVLRQSGDTA
jgi:hypothetical protein